MQWNAEVPKDFEPEFMMGAATGRNIMRLAVILAIVAAVALAIYYVATRPAYTFEGQGAGTIQVGKVTLDGTYRLLFYAPAAARIWLWPEAGTCQSTTGSQEGEMLISATRCIARLTIIANGTIDYKVEIRSAN